MNLASRQPGSGSGPPSIGTSWNMNGLAGGRSIDERREALGELIGEPVIVVAAGLTDDLVPALYECLRQIGATERLSVVLATAGGFVTTARRVALLIREYTRHLTILVPYRARSAGTLLCLSANRLVLCPLSELSPIDPHVMPVGDMPSGGPLLMSGEEIKSFRPMAEDWFGVSREEDRLQVMALVAQRIFPTTLTSFYRFDQMIRSFAHEMLLYQLPGDGAATVRERIVDRLVGGCHAHDYPIVRSDARALGLAVEFAPLAEEALLWELQVACRAQLAGTGGHEGEHVTGLLVGPGFCAHAAARTRTEVDGEVNGLSYGPSSAVPMFGRTGGEEHP